MIIQWLDLGNLSPESHTYFSNWNDIWQVPFDNDYCWIEWVVWVRGSPSYSDEGLLRISSIKVSNQEIHTRHASRGYQIFLVNNFKYREIFSYEFSHAFIYYEIEVSGFYKLELHIFDVWIGTSHGIKFHPLGLTIQVTPNKGLPSVPILLRKNESNDLGHGSHQTKASHHTQVFLDRKNESCDLVYGSHLTPNKVKLCLLWIEKSEHESAGTIVEKR